ncbi:MAG: pyridoxal-phosphate dependent enzyme [Planctomycetota bacterium]
MDSQRDISIGRQLLEELDRQTKLASKRIYELDNVTPLDTIPLPQGCQLWLKREDQSRIHSYKWRGSFNKISQMVGSGFSGTMVAASAGNHAQGVAISARKMKLPATIFMPLSTPQLKQDSVRQFGGDFVDIRLVGDTFDESYFAAKQFAESNGGEIIPPYDDLIVIAGQSTIGTELTEQLKSDPTHIFLEVGGGGMASGVAAVMHRHYPDAQLFCVEASEQNCMGQSLKAERPVTLTSVDKFCDGTAVSRPGQIPFDICRQLIPVENCLTVTNEQVCEAIQYLWQTKRTIVEPSAGIGVAAAMNFELGADDVPVTILSGANVDFMTLPTIARKGLATRPETRYFAFEIAEQSGSLISLLDNFLADMNIIDFQYGKNSLDVATPVIGVELPQSKLSQLEQLLSSSNLPPHREVTGTAAADFRVIPFNIERITYPFFAVIEFPNRPGALREFMRIASDLASVCYMNYTDTGQTEGQALMGFEFQNIADQTRFLDWLPGYTQFDVVPIEHVRNFQSNP